METLVRDVEEESAELPRLIEPLAPYKWERVTPSDRWTITDQAGHLAYFDERAALAVTDRLFHVPTWACGRSPGRSTGTQRARGRGCGSPSGHRRERNRPGMRSGEQSVSGPLEDSCLVVSQRRHVERQRPTDEGSGGPAVGGGWRGLSGRSRSGPFSVR